MSISTGILFGFITLVGYGISDAISAVPARSMGVRHLVFLRNLLIASILFVLVLLFGSWPSVSPFWLIFSIMVSLFGCIPLMTFYRGLQLGKVGVISPVAKSSLVVTVLLAFIFLDESLSFLQLFAFVLIFSGIILISIKFEDIRASELFSLRHGVPYALLSCLFWGVSFFLFKFIVNAYGPLISAFFVESGVLVFSAASLLASPKERKKICQLPNKRIRWYILGIALTTLAGTTSYMFGVSMAPVSIISALAFSNPAISVLYARFALKEQLRPLQYVAVVLIVMGIIFMSV